MGPDMKQLLAAFVFALTCSAQAGPLGDLVAELEFGKLQATFDQEKVNRMLGPEIPITDFGERQAAAVLMSLGAIGPQGFGNVEAIEKAMSAFQEQEPTASNIRLGRTGDPQLYANLRTIWDHAELLEADDFLEDLSNALSSGVITGYDLREVGVYDGFPPGRTFIYSQSSLLHLRQLVALLNSENLNVTVYGTPKVSAFVYRDDWGAGADRMTRELPGGVRVVNGREVAMLFEFRKPEDRFTFHRIIEKYAKRDTADEPGLIENAWWQPFYYTDTPMDGFEEIGLIVLASERFEATLTVLPEKVEAVLSALGETRWSKRVDRVWVNPPFYRFLQGGYR